ncbi:unnamed protein product [Prorocentrum cordatum]|uniref:Ribosome biogenesis protein NOP53 n=1 Tax=Prorocentrum cordatum TaxID=2364126 RepID=A0ABN9RMX8_9DINO|nr:unnamed protein product [Polarella glacialis]
MRLPLDAGRGQVKSTKEELVPVPPPPPAMLKPLDQVELKIFRDQSMYPKEFEEEREGLHKKHKFVDRTSEEVFYPVLVGEGAAPAAASGATDPEATTEAMAAAAGTPATKGPVRQPRKELPPDELKEKRRQRRVNRKEKKRGRQAGDVLQSELDVIAARDSDEGEAVPEELQQEDFAVADEAGGASPDERGGDLALSEDVHVQAAAHGADAPSELREGVDDFDEGSEPTGEAEHDAGAHIAGGDDFGLDPLLLQGWVQQLVEGEIDTNELNKLVKSALIAAHS